MYADTMFGVYYNTYSTPKHLAFETNQTIFLRIQLTVGQYSWSLAMPLLASILLQWSNILKQVPVLHLHNFTVHISMRNYWQCRTKLCCQLFVAIFLVYTLPVQWAIVPTVPMLTYNLGLTTCRMELCSEGVLHSFWT